MVRLAIFLFGALAFAVPALAAPTLQPAVTVTGGVVRLGDLFADAGPKADDTVAVAPRPGTRVTYNADWLAATAHEHGLDWQPSSPFDLATVVRASRTVSIDDIAKQMLAEIGTRQPIGDAELQLDNPGLRLVIAADAPDAIAIDGLAIDQRTGRVSAFVSAPAGDPAAVRQRIAGRLVYRIDVPVLNHPAAAGAIIAAGDLDLVKLRRDRLAQNVATDATELVGKTLRRPLPAGEAVRLDDVLVPLLVHKGELVTIVLTTPSMQLTAQGKALDDGAAGALVRIANTKSNRIIDAAVAGAGIVAVTVPGVPAAPALTAAR
jgi:flagella basal body P-ring formation protein FlgA